MIQAVHHFPRGFLWGTATAAHQVEGGNMGNDWWEWESQPGRILNGHTSGLACDWWAGRWRDDLGRAAEGHQNAHRLSLEWSRIEPEPGTFDEAALGQYRLMIEGAVELGLTPMVTLHHFTNPLWLADKGGWLAPSVAEDFSRYVRHVAGALGKQVKLWVTINEPNVYAYSAYASGDFPPGRRNLWQAFSVMENMVRAHAAAYRCLHEVVPDAQVGIAGHYRHMEPARRRNPLDRWLAGFRSRIFNRAIPEALVNGRLDLIFKRLSIPEASGAQDFLGLNYYTREIVAFDPLRPGKAFEAGFFLDGDEQSPTGFIANVPEGFWQALRWAQAFNLPIYITENGIEGHDDGLRRRYLLSHLRQLWRAANFNWGIKGYFHWTLVDNFEWERGWTQPFGLWELDRDTQARTPRPSARLYADICRANALSSQLVAEHVPELLDDLFPEEGPGALDLAAPKRGV